MTNDSLFTKIIHRELPATIQYEDDQFIAFNDIHPKAPVHVLIVPKIPYQTLEEVPVTDVVFLGKLLQTVRLVAKKLGIEQNYQIHMNVGHEVQLVEHIHVHLLGGWKNPQEVR